MKKIKDNIYIESSYSGVTTGAVPFSGGTLFIDAPLRPEDSQDWIAALGKLGATPPYILVNLDSHPDRSLGVQNINAQVIMHEDSGEHLRQRAAIFKSLKQESGAEWEKIEDISSLKWVVPKLVFNDHMYIKVGDGEALIEVHEGPSPGSSWLILAEAKVVFIGDAVVKKEPPFLAYADIPAWIDSLDLLLSKEYKGVRIISGRSGEINSADIREQRRFLQDVAARIKRLGKRKAAQSEASKLSEKLLDKYKYPTKHRNQYLQRLRHGLQGYYTRHYFPSTKSI